MATSSETSDQNNVKSKRPAESAFKQQRLPAWQPILTAGTVLPTFFVIGIAFIPVGIGLLYFSDEVKEHVIDYTECTKTGDTITCADYIKQNDMTKSPKCMCELELNLTEDFKSDVFFYYGLSNYYQNHRRYVKSRDDSQLLGRLNLQPSSDCEPFAYDFDQNGVKRPVAPCGAIANSLFNDTLTLYSQEQQVNVPVLRTGIAWASDKEIKFRNPVGYASLKEAFANFTKPANWAKQVWELDPENVDNNGFQNEDLIVWMRTAALPTFRKLYRRVDHTQIGFRTGLNKGPYTLRIEYNYPVTDFDGTKSFVISTTSLLGGKNPFLGVAYVVVGTLCLLLGIVLLIIHVRCSKRIPQLIESESAMMSRAAQEPKGGSLTAQNKSPSDIDNTEERPNLKQRTKQIFGIKQSRNKKNAVTAVEVPYLDNLNYQVRTVSTMDQPTENKNAFKPLTEASETTKLNEDGLKTPDVSKKPESTVTPLNPFKLASETKSTSVAVEMTPVSTTNLDAGDRTLETHSAESILVKLPSTELGASDPSVARNLSRQTMEHDSQRSDNDYSTLKSGSKEEDKKEDETKSLHESDMVNGENLKDSKLNNRSHDTEGSIEMEDSDETLKGRPSQKTPSSSRSRTSQSTKVNSEISIDRKSE